MTIFKQFLAIFLTLAALGSFLYCFNGKIDSGAKIAVLEGQKSKNEVEETVQDICSEGSCVEDTLKLELAQEQERLIKDVQAAIPVTQNAWQKTFEDMDTAIKGDTLLTNNPRIKNKKSDHDLVKKARKILVEYNIDPSRVTIKTIERPDTKTNAASFQGYENNKVVHDLVLNIPQLSQHPDDVQDAIIRHEIMHLLNYDPLRRAYIEVMFLDNGIKKEEFMKVPALLKLYQHQEFRADLLAACHSIDTAQSFQKDFQHYIKTHPEDQLEINCITHPSDADRHEAVTQLISYMQAESTIKVA